MTTAPSGPTLFSMFSAEASGTYHTRREAFVFSLLGQAIALALLTYFTCCILEGPPIANGRFPRLKELPLIFSGYNGGGGGNHDPLPATHGSLPQASLEQLAPPTVKRPTEMPKLAVPETVIMAPDVVIPQGPIGDPTSKFTSASSDGPGGPGGIGPGCCGGDGDSTGPYGGSGSSGPYPAGKNGVTVPQAIFSPEPSFSDEARKARMQGVVILLLVVGKDGKPYNIRVGQTLGMGLDEKAIEAVTRWRFKPATRDGVPVATQIAVEVDFHLY
jgi:periplasmic protein TonB